MTRDLRALADELVPNALLLAAGPPTFVLRRTVRNGQRELVRLIAAEQPPGHRHADLRDEAVVALRRLWPAETAATEIPRVQALWAKLDAGTISQEDLAALDELQERLAGQWGPLQELALADAAAAWRMRVIALSMTVVDWRGPPVPWRFDGERVDIAALAEVGDWLRSTFGAAGATAWRQIGDAALQRVALGAPPEAAR
jgi:hypothetical protein